jgi:uncharacterized protein YkwD
MAQGNLSRPTHARSYWCVLLLGALSACGGGDDGRPSSSSLLSYAADGQVQLDGASTCGLPDFQNSLLAEINAARAEARSCGALSMPAVGALTWNSRLFSAAARHSADMATHDYFSHTGRDGRTPGQRISAEGYRWSIAGENIAAGQTSVASVMAGWLASPDHCTNLMSNAHREVGVACVVAPVGATYSRYWTMKLGASR